MKVKDYKESNFKIGMRIQSVKSKRQGTIHKIDHDEFHWILWDGDTKPFSGFYYNDCDCEVVMTEDNEVYTASDLRKIADASQAKKNEIEEREGRKELLAVMKLLLKAANAGERKTTTNTMSHWVRKTLVGYGYKVEDHSDDMYNEYVISGW